MKKSPLNLKTALAAVPKAKAQWKDLTPIARRDFITWIDGAKQEETRLRRITKACSVLAEGKRRPCCYAVVPMKLYKALDVKPKAKVQWKSLTPDGRRDFVEWIDAAKNSSEKQQRIDKAAKLLAVGKKQP